MFAALFTDTKVLCCSECLTLEGYFLTFRSRLNSRAYENQEQNWHRLLFFISKQLVGNFLVEIQ